MKGISHFLFIVFIISNMTIHAQEQETHAFPFVGVVTTDSVNVRAGANINFEIVTQLDKNKNVVVLEEKFGWYKIEAPEEANFWIFHEYVEEDLINAYSVNVRCGPGTHYSVNTQVEKGDKVEVIEKKDQWLRIKAPKDASTWISKDYVKFEKTLELYLKEKKEMGEARRIAEKKVKMWEEASELEKEELKKEIREMELSPVIEKYEKMKEEFSDES